MLCLNYGDALQINGQDSNTNEQVTWYAVVKRDADASRDATVDVEYIKQDPATRVWTFEGDVYECPTESICAHAPYDEQRGPQYAWAELGFRQLGPSSFVLLDEEAAVPIGDAAFELHSDSEDDEPETQADRDFIVDDKDAEPFTLADESESSQFVRDTHAAVRGFRSWEPTDDQGRTAKACIESLAARAAALDDNRRFETGMPALDYNTPS